jgi:hypothetical protein
MINTRVYAIADKNEIVALRPVGSNMAPLNMQDVA